MKANFLKLIQFIAGVLVLMEAVKELDSGFAFPWFYLSAGILIISFVPLLPLLTTKYHFAGAVLFFIEGVVLIIIALRLWGDLRKYGALLYIVTSVIILFYAFRNIRKL